MCNCRNCHESCRCQCHVAYGRGGQLMAVEHSSLTTHQRDLIARRDLLRSNADGARRMAASFDDAADALNAQITGDTNA